MFATFRRPECRGEPVCSIPYLPACALLLPLLQGCGPDNAGSDPLPLEPAAGSTVPAVTLNLYFDRVTHQYGTRDVHNIFRVKDDGSDLVQLTYSPADKEFDNQYPAVSPDGTLIAFMTMRHREDAGNGNTAEIYLMNADGTNQVRLTSNALDDDAPRWCGNSRLVYSQDGAIVEMDAADLDGDGNGDNRVTIVAGSNDRYNHSVDCSASSIVFLRNEPGLHVVLADRSGGNEMYLGGGEMLIFEQPRFSPDGNRIVFGSNLADASMSVRDIYVMDAVDTDNDQQGDNLQRVTTSNSGSGSSNPVWSPDGGFVAYSRNSGNYYEIRKAALGNGTDTQVVPSPPNGFAGDWQ